MDVVQVAMSDITLKNFGLYLIKLVKNQKRIEELIKGFLKQPFHTPIVRKRCIRIRQQLLQKQQNQSQKLDFTLQKHRDSPGYDEASTVAIYLPTIMYLSPLTESLKRPLLIGIAGTRYHYIIIHMLPLRIAHGHTTNFKRKYRRQAPQVLALFDTGFTKPNNLHPAAYPLTGG